MSGTYLQRRHIGDVLRGKDRHSGSWNRLQTGERWAAEMPMDQMASCRSHSFTACAIQSSAFILHSIFGNEGTGASDRRDGKAQLERPACTATPSHCG